MPFFNSTLADFCGNRQQIEKIKQEIQKQLSAPSKKPILIYGPTGVGKTYLIQLLADELNLELVVIKSDNFRTRKSITEAKQIASQQSLFGMKKLIFMDDADSISGRLAAKTGDDIKKEKEDKKKAGKRKIKETKLKSPQKEAEELIRISKYPVIFSAQDLSAKSLKAIKKIATRLELKKVPVEETVAFLSKVCQTNNIEYEQKALDYIARVCDSDIRCALIETEVAYLTDGKISYNKISKDNFRDSVSDIKKCLKIIFKSRSINASMEVMSKNNEDKGTFAEWIRENIPHQYTKPEDIKNAYEMLSNADIFRGRIKATYWRYLVYISMFLSAGIAISKKQRYETGPSDFRFPSKIATYARMKFHVSNDTQITEYMNEHCHLSKKKIKNNMAVYRKLYNS